MTLSFFPDRTASPPARRLGLHNRLSLWLTGLVVLWLMALVGLWLHDTRTSIREEMRMGTQVSRHMLRSLTRQAGSETAVLALVQPLGRIRAHELQLQEADGTVRYTSPPSLYKVGRHAPGWFSALLTPRLPGDTLMVGAQRLVLTPDASRAVLDAWDNLVAASGWAALGLVLLAGMARLALRRALLPLHDIMAALDRTGRGRFDTRLPLFAEPDLARISHAFNAMADRLTAAVNENVALEKERELAQHVQSELARERTDMARELHDELAQDITAVRALAGAIAQRSTAQPALHGHAHGIIAVTGEMQEGVRRILQRLRDGDSATWLARLQAHVQAWRQQHGAASGVTLESHFDLDPLRLPAPVAQCALRIVQEGLTNIARHAPGASRVQLSLVGHASALHIGLIDDGNAPATGHAPTALPGCGLGLQGMRERIAALGGQLQAARPDSGGFQLLAVLPLAQAEQPARTTAAEKGAA